MRARQARQLDDFDAASVAQGGGKGAFGFVGIFMGGIGASLWMVLGVFGVFEWGFGKFLGCLF